MRRKVIAICALVGLLNALCVAAIWNYVMTDPTYSKDLSMGILLERITLFVWPGWLYLYAAHGEEFTASVALVWIIAIGSNPLLYALVAWALMGLFERLRRPRQLSP